MARWAFGLAVGAPFTAASAVYDFALGDANNRTMRMYVPDGISVVRGLLIWGNGQGSDLRAMATDPELVAVGESMGFAVIGTSMWTNFVYGYTPSELSAFESGLQQLAAMSNHPEIVRAPWLPVGQSNGGAMSYAFANLRPEKVIALAANKAAYYNDSRPGSAALRIPGLLVAGEIDTDLRRMAIRDLFTGNRPRGALWAWTEEQMANHNYGDTFELILPFAEEVYRMRYPANASPQFGTVPLRGVDETAGWLTDPDSFKDGIATIAAYADYPKDKSGAGWLPSRRLAYIFRAFSSYSLARYEVNLSTGHGPVAWGTRATYSIGEPIADWSRIEFFDGDILLKTLVPGSAEPLAVDTVLDRAGYAVFHALITFSDGGRQTTMPRRVFVTAPAGGAIAGPTTVAENTDMVLSAAAPPGNAGEFQWQINVGAVWTDLADGEPLVLGGATCRGAQSAKLALDRVPQALDGSQFRCRFSGTGVSVSSTAALAVVHAPAIVVAQGAPTASIAAGDTVDFSAQSSDSSVTYRWYRNGVLVPDATGSAWRLTKAGTADVGAYSVVATTAAGVATTASAGRLSVVATSWLANLSARAAVQTDDGILAAGFVTRGVAADERKRILLRGIGPTLGLPPFNLAGALRAAQLQVFDAAGAAVDDATHWETGLDSVFSSVGAFALPAGSHDAALLESLSPGLYTTSLRPADGAPGVGVVEIYDADATAPAHRLINLSARANVGGGGGVLIGGFVVRGTGAMTVMLRAVGLGLREFLPASMLQPVLTLYDANGRVMASNTGWLQPITRGDSALAGSVQPSSARAMAKVGAFLLPEPQMSGYQAGWDSALVATLSPGLYTAIVSSADGTSGTALVEIYEVP